MSAGDFVCHLYSIEVTNAAADDRTISGGSAVDAALPAKSFRADVISYAGVSGMMPGSYAGAGIKLRLALRAVMGVVGAAKMEAAFHRCFAGDIFTASKTFTWQGVTVTAPAAVASPAYAEIPFTQNQADGVAAGEEFVVLIRRKADDAADTMAGGALLSRAVLLYS